MFTGIVEELGIVQNIKRENKFVRLAIKANKVLKDVNIGDSLSVNGVCLTIVEIKKDIIFFDCIEETLRLTNLGFQKKLDKVNLERPLKLKSFVSGHFLLGHIDGMGKITKKIDRVRQTEISIRLDKKLLEYIIPKGSIGVDGISLTVVEVGRDYFTTLLIPHTLRLTSLGFKGVGNLVNVEIDILAKYLRKFLPFTFGKKSPLDKDFLRAYDLI